MTTFLELENHLLVRLKEILPSNIRVYSSPSVEFSAVDLAEFSPAVHIIYDGYSIKNLTTVGMGTVYAQRWNILIAVKNVNKLESGQPARTEASAIIDAVLLGLNGYQPPNIQFSRLTPINSQNSIFSNGVMFFSVAYESNLPINSNVD